ncbi:SH3 and cysteine-rich domain-containing protein 2 isoform X1 [Solea senegalensis]|uniref:SH3 and cysteine-rich domain-containing protein 2 n=1 Tax=Solea senegalensis TaxID=28829 RepID=A0AAV6RLL5_SOLSE|nr:SH3 and cysteine-rich domain-containing protein 2-like isoform X1 [Solea senegalensis]KAG7505384.1 SH3 and cysteine-rich domain-containing protein 2 isoform X1 [Solea senegalensis]
MITENNEMESDAQLQRSPSTMSVQPRTSKLQRLKRSLSFKTIMRSNSVENFFQRSYSDARLPPDFITDPPPPSPPLLPGSPLVGDRSPSISPSLSPNPSISSHSPSLSLSPSLPTKPPRPLITHCFQDHVFRKPTNCQHCKHMIVGNSKQALRCKTCKMAAHLWCTSELSQQLCHGKPGVFKRNFSSPMLVNDQLAVVKEVQPSQEAVRTRVDPVYAALRYGTSLGQMSRSSLSESPTCSLDEGGEERQQRQCSMEEEITQETGDAAVPVTEMEKEEDESGGQAQTPAEEKVPKRIEVHSIHTYVALYRFLPQEQNDLELHPGDRVQVTDDSNEEWWKGKSGDRVGFFPANFVQRVRPGERVWRVIQNVPCSRERGHMAVRESQICVGKQEDGEVFLKLSSGKKRGLVPADSIEEI